MAALWTKHGVVGIVYFDTRSKLAPAYKPQVEFGPDTPGTTPVALHYRGNTARDDEHAYP